MRSGWGEAERAPPAPGDHQLRQLPSAPRAPPASHPLGVHRQFDQARHDAIKAFCEANPKEFTTRDLQTGETLFKRTQV